MSRLARTASWAVLGIILAWTGLAWGQSTTQSGTTRLTWDSPDVVESRMTVYKYTKSGPEYVKPTDPKAPDPGTNYMIGLTVSDEPPRLMDRLLKRNAVVTGKLVAPPAGPFISVWLEDNYGRRLDSAQPKAPDYAFRLDASASLSTGLYLRAEVAGSGRVFWKDSQEIRMLPADYDEPWRDFLLGVYNTGTKAGTGKLFRDIGLGHQVVQTTNSPLHVAQADLRFHASNILYSLLGLYHRDFVRWREIKAKQAASRGPVTLERHRCLSDPKEEKFVRDILSAAAMRFAPYAPLCYGIGDEIGIGDMAAPADLCASQWCMPRFRAFLKETYGSIDKLNAQWETSYKDFDQVEMFSTWQGIARAGKDNFSPWADRLEFNDRVLAGAVDVGVAAVRKIDPKAHVSISGVQQPSCWGFDHWRLSRVVDRMTPYDIGEGPDVLMSFYNDGADGQLVDPGFGQGCEELWRSFIRNYAMAQQWDSQQEYSKLIDVDKQEPTEFGKAVGAWADWVHAGPGRLRNRSTRQRDPVAILYSQPSLRGNWMLEITSRPDVQDGGDKWVARGSHSVRQKEMSFRVRVSWVEWMHDVGIWPKFVDASQVDQGYLESQGFKVLVLPRAVAISDKTAAAIREFANAGGTVVADSLAGIMDEHCRARSKGVLDDLFGVTRGDYHQLNVSKFTESMGHTGKELPFVTLEKTLKGAGLETNPPGLMMASKTVGTGRAIYLNVNMEEYFLQRFYPATVAPARAFLLDLLDKAGVKPLFAVVSPDGKQPFHPVGQEVAVYRNGRGYLVGVMNNPTRRVSELGGIESRYENIKDNPFLKPAPARLTVPAGLFVYDLAADKPLGKLATVDFQAQPETGKVFACWPFEISGLEAKATVEKPGTVTNFDSKLGRRLKIAGKLLTSLPVEGETLVVAVKVFRSDGTEQRAYRRAIDCDKESFAVDFPLAVNETGQWTVEVTDPCSGQKATVKVDLGQ